MKLQCLIDYRWEHGLTQSEMAELLNVSQPHISFLERGLKPVNPIKVKFYSLKTGIPKSELRPDLFDKEIDD